MSALAVAGLITACTNVQPEPPETSAAECSGAECEEPTPAPDPLYAPDGSVEENLPAFEAVIAATWAGGNPLDGRSYVDALVSAGFPKEQMQVSESATPVLGGPIETLQISVLHAGRCLMGQVGPSTGEPLATITDSLAGDNCLIGATAPIDW